MEIGLFVFLAVGAVALFTFVAVASWSDARRQERVALYRSELLKEVAKHEGVGAREVMALLQREAIERQKERRRGLLLGGALTAAVGVGLMLLLAGVGDRDFAAWKVGLIPLLIGATLFLFGWFARPPRIAALEAGAALPSAAERDQDGGRGR
jgi:hypothetical protein